MMGPQRSVGGGDRLNREGLTAMPDDALALLEIIGIRPILIEGLGRDAVLSLRAGVVLLDDALNTDDIDDIVDQVLSRAASALPAT